jgi:hypothetical protein
MRVLIVVALFLFACDEPNAKPSPAPDTSAKVAEVALACVEISKTCEGWDPSPMWQDLDLIECGKYEYECQRQRKKIELGMAYRSPCQQKLDSCVAAAQAVAEAGQAVTNHYHQHLVPLDTKR